MTLIQKLPLGLALAACMIMSSCSKEDVQAPKPQTEKVTAELSPHRGVSPAPYIPTTNGSTGNNTFAPGWAKWITHSPDNPVQYATGTSSTAYLWGNPSLPWIKPLFTPFENGGNIITFMTQRSVYTANSSTASAVYTKIKNLTPGKKYSLKIYGAATALDTTQYGSDIFVEISNTPADDTETIDLQQIEGQWVAKTIVFEATSEEALVRISGKIPNGYVQAHPKFYHFLHVFIGTNAVKELQVL